MVYPRLIVWFFLLFILGAGGCQRGASFVPIEGTVTKAGQPLAGAQILFYPDLKSDMGGPIARGLTDVDGHYRLKADSGGDGAVVGEYRVCIVDPGPFADMRNRPGRRRIGSSKWSKIVSSRADQEPTERKVTASYGDAGKTPLRADVRPGGLQTFDFNIP